MLYRKIEKEIVKWIREDHRGLLIDGARQVGKTFIIKGVMEKLGCDYLEFNLIKTPELVKLFEKSSSEDDLITNLSLFAGKPFVRRKTFVFIDEIQEFKELATKLKFWVDGGDFRYIFSGSLLGVELKGLRSAPVGYLKTLTMYPLDFEEFLQIYNLTPELRNSLHVAFTERTPVNEAVHERLVKIFNMYLNVGGMPAAVESFRKSKNMEDVISEHENIMSLYKKDFTKYEREEKKAYLTQIYDLIPAELNAPNKRFNYADIKKGLRFERSQDNFVWLAESGAALPVYNVTAPEVPLLLNEKSSLFKLFLSDVGMLTTACGRATKMQLLSDNGDINHGAIYENAAAQELVAHGLKLYYYNSKKFGELDFVTEYRGRVLPIEIKSGKDYYRHSALNNVLSTGKHPVDEAFVFSDYNVSVDGKVVYYPIYMMMFLEEEKIDMPLAEDLDLSDLGEPDH